MTKVIENITTFSNQQRVSFNKTVITLEKLVFSTKKLNCSSSMEQAACRKDNYMLRNCSVTRTILKQMRKNISGVVWIFLGWWIKNHKLLKLLKTSTFTSEISAVQILKCTWEDMLLCFIICFSPWLLSPLTLLFYMQWKKLKEQREI